MWMLEQRGTEIGEKDPMFTLDVNWAGNLISEVFLKKIGSEICKVLCFRDELLYMY